MIPRFNCVEKPPVIDGVFYDPSVSNNLVAQNKVSGNGTNPPPVGPPLDDLARTSPISPSRTRRVLVWQLL